MFICRSFDHRDLPLVQIASSLKTPAASIELTVSASGTGLGRRQQHVRNPTPQRLDRAGRGRSLELVQNSGRTPSGTATLAEAAVIMPTAQARNWSAASLAAIRKAPAIQAALRPAATTRLSRGGSRRNRTRSRLLGIGDRRLQTGRRRWDAPRSNRIVETGAARECRGNDRAY